MIHTQESVPAWAAGVGWFLPAAAYGVVGGLLWRAWRLERCSGVRLECGGETRLGGRDARLGGRHARASPYASISWKKCQQAAIFPIYGCALLIAYVYIISYISEFGRESLYEMKKCDKESGLLAVWKI